MVRSIKTRLSVMMFLQYSVAGVVAPIISHYLKNHLRFEPFQVGQILAMPAVAATVAPFLIVYIADRAVSAERLLAMTHFLAGAAMLVLSVQTRFWTVLVLYFAYGLLFMPTYALTNAVAFHHIVDARRDFGSIRMWGPLSWVVVALSFSFVWLRGGAATGLNTRLADALKVSAFLSCALGVYALTLPLSQVKSEQSMGLSLGKAFAVFARPSMVLLCVVTFLNAAVHQFYYYGMSPFLSQIGFPDKYIMPAMSTGQFAEFFVLALLGVCLAKIGIKGTLIIGVVTQAARCLAFATGNRLLTLFAIPSHGICYACFFAVAYIYVDRHSTPENRAGAQQLFNILITGIGCLGGNLWAGKTAEFLTPPGTTQTDFAAFWIISAVIALFVAVLLLFFKEEEPSMLAESSAKSRKGTQDWQLQQK